MEKVSDEFLALVGACGTGYGADRRDRGFGAEYLRYHSKCVSYYIGGDFFSGLLIQCRAFLWGECRFEKGDNQGTRLCTHSRCSGGNLYVSHWYCGVMKQFTTYTAIRRKAQLLGLPLLLFAVQLIAVIVSLLLIIFSFGMGLILGLLVLNVGLYVGLLQYQQGKLHFSLGTVFPKELSNQHIRLWYEKT